MKKVIFLISFLVLATTNGWVSGKAVVATNVAVAICHTDYGNTDTPLGEGEENSEEDKDITEEDDDVSLDHKWLSRDQSSNTDLHILYLEALFQDLESEVVIPPPKA